MAASRHLRSLLRVPSSATPRSFALAFSGRGSAGPGGRPGSPANPGRAPGSAGPDDRSGDSAGPDDRPEGSRFGDVTSGRIAPGGLARIERRWISSRWARTARGGADSVALSSHYASRARIHAGPGRPGLNARHPESCPTDPGPVHFHAPVLPDVEAGSCTHEFGPDPRRSGVVADSAPIPRSDSARLQKPSSTPPPPPAPGYPGSGSARSSLDPQARTSSRRARGSSDDLGGYPAIPRTRAAPRPRAPSERRPSGPRLRTRTPPRPPARAAIPGPLKSPSTFGTSALARPPGVVTRQSRGSLHRTGELAGVARHGGDQFGDCRRAGGSAPRKGGRRVLLRSPRDVAHPRNGVIALFCDGRSRN